MPRVTRFSFDALGGFYPNSRTSQVFTQMLLQTLLSTCSMISVLFCKPFSSPPWIADRRLLMGSSSGTLPSQRVAGYIGNYEVLRKGRDGASRALWQCKYSVTISVLPPRVCLQFERIPVAPAVLRQVWLTRHSPDSPRVAVQRGYFWVCQTQSHQFKMSLWSPSRGFTAKLPHLWVWEYSVEREVEALSSLVEEFVGDAGQPAWPALQQIHKHPFLEAEARSISLSLIQFLMSK